ncbi:MAG TPA: FHA domain-containing protein [Polyangiaceae bacterium]|nr:FHA domain-containing protein [Polyangiaceae bacterium]
MSKVLLAPIVVVAPDGEHELLRGSLSVGRNPSADITLDDPLISRSHARIVVLGDGSVAVEDLHSTNGVYVNGVRLGRNSQRLREGDRLLIGTCELGVFGAPQAVASPSHPTEPAPPPSAADVEAPATDRADGMQMVAKLADRLNRSGNAAEAVRVLSGHLNKVLLGASAGLAVPAALLEDASRQALELFRWTYNAAWLDYVIELHLTAQELPSEAILAALEGAFASPNGAQLDSDLLRYYVESLERTRPSLTLSEEARRLRLQRLAR